MTTADIHALTGAYALDAVSGVERMEFERHLSECEACAQEVHELRETATRLALAAAASPPPALKGRVLDQIKTVRQLPPETTVTPLRRRSMGQRLTSVAAGVFFVATAGLGVVVVQQNQQLDDSRAYSAQLEHILDSGDAQSLTLPMPGGGQVNVAVSRRLDEMLLLSDDLANPPEGKTFQVWTLDPGNPRSMGFLEPSDGNVALTVRGFSDASKVAVSEEPAGGSETPTNVLVGGDLPAE